MSVRSPITRFDIAVVGGGIVGLAAATSIMSRFPDARLVLVEKEQEFGRHQTGRNSGVLHSGIYYPPGSLKARLCIEGGREMTAFCAAHGIPLAFPGKVIVATRPDEIAGMDRLAERAQAHGIPFERIGPDGLRDLEPNADGLAALHLEGTGILDYTRVLHALAADFQAAGGVIMMGASASEFRQIPWGHRLTVGAEMVDARFLVTCAGLQSDRVARASGADIDERIIPFKGEYFELVHERRDLVRGLIYPVPDPDFPFLGVHLTKAISGDVHAGPNAVLALEREGYGRLSVDRHDTWETFSYPGFWRLAGKHWRAGAHEVARSFSKRLFLHSLQRLVPSIQLADLVPAPPGIRAQAVTRRGGLVDDFLLVESANSLHVCNAPSPAATASLAIGREIASRVSLTSLVG